MIFYRLVLAIFLLNLVSIHNLFAEELTMVPWGKADKDYQTYGLTRSSSDGLYVSKDFRFESYLRLPYEVIARTNLDQNNQFLEIEVGNFISSNADDDVELASPEGAKPAPYWILADYISVESTKEFREFLKEANDKDENLKIQIEDRRDHNLKLVKDRLNRTDFETMDKAITNLYRSSLQKQKRLKISYSSSKKNLFKAADLEEMTPFIFKIKDLASIQQVESVNLQLPDVERLDIKNRSLVFYEAFAILDKIMLPELQRQRSFDKLDAIPQVAWRRNLLEKSFKIYFKDELNNSKNVCQGYSVRAIPGSGLENITLDFYSLQPTTIEISQKISEVNSF